MTRITHLIYQVIVIGVESSAAASQGKLISPNSSIYSGERSISCGSTTMLVFTVFKEAMQKTNRHYTMKANKRSKERNKKA